MIFALLLSVGAVLNSSSASVSAVIAAAGIASSFLLLEMKRSGPVSLLPVICWLAFSFGGTIPGILTSLASLATGLSYHWKSEPARLLLLSCIPVSILFAVTVPSIKVSSILSFSLIPAGILIQTLFFMINRKKLLFPLRITSLKWLIFGIIALIARYFLIENDFAGGFVVFGVMLMSLNYAIRTGSSLARYTSRINTLSLQNRLVSSLYSNEDNFQLYLREGNLIWTMQGKPINIEIEIEIEIEKENENANLYTLEKCGKWYTVSTEKSIFIAGKSVACELRSLDSADLRETLELLETVWNASFSKRRLENAFIGAAGMFVKLADKKDSDTHHHSIRVSQMSIKLAKLLGLPENEMFQLRVGSLLHDIGKLGLPGSLIMKKGLLTESERTVVETHPGEGSKLLGPILKYSNASSIVLQHHEHIDGSGYPQGISGSSISLNARIVAVADVFDAITSPRAYHLGKPSHIALREIKKYRGTHFDASVVDALEVLLS